MPAEKVSKLMEAKMDKYEEWAVSILPMVKEKMKWVSIKNKDKIPYTTDKNGGYDDRADESLKWSDDDGINWWTNGFFGGIMWLLYSDTAGNTFLEIARIQEKKLGRCFEKFYGLHHDVGFMFVPTAVADYRITGNEESRKTALLAASLLAGRFNPEGNFIRAWNDIKGSDTRGWAIIDCMFNISLLYWASDETGDPRFKNIAMRHADTVADAFIREDGSVCHIVEFDPESGRVIKSHGGQGYKEGSSWTRGQGWALYGFTNSYRHTGKKEYLDAAIKVAEYCLSNIDESAVIPIDFRQPDEPAYEDSCGACVIAGGFLELSEYVDGDLADKYKDCAYRILKRIAEERADFTQKCDAIVKGCSAAYHGDGHDMTMVYGDYFFIEALYKMSGSSFKMW